MRNLKKILSAVFFLLFAGNLLLAQQTTTWTSVSPRVWESITSDGLVRVECRVSAGVFISGSETMGCDPTTYSNPSIFGSPSLEISVSQLLSGTIEFSFFDTATNSPVYIVNPLLHVDKVGTFALLPLPLLGFSSTTGVFESTNGSWTNLASNGPIFESTATQFNIDAATLLGGNGGECGNGIDTGAGGGTMQMNDAVQSINMDVFVTSGLLSFPEKVEFVLSDLVISEPEIEVTKTVIEKFGDPVSRSDTVDYIIKVENTGNVTLNTIRLTDTFTDAQLNTLSLTTGPTFNNSTLGSLPGTLLADEVATYLASYTLTESELEAGGIINQVEVLANSPLVDDDVSDISDDGNPMDGNTENDPTESFFPSTMDDLATVCEIGTLNINVLSNDDFGGNGPSDVSIFIVSTPASGIAVVDDNSTPSLPSDDSIIYTSNPGYSGSDSFIYGISDAQGHTQHATVTLTEQAAPDAGSDGALVICEGDTATTARLFDSLGGTPDPGGAWTPALAGAGTYTYTVSATSPCTADATSEVAVSEQPSPDAVNDVFTIDDNTSLNGDVSINDQNIVTANFTITTNPLNGIVSMAANGSFTYTPNENFNGTDIFGYSLEEPTCGTDTAIANVVVNPIIHLSYPYLPSTLLPRIM